MIRWSWCGNMVMCGNVVVVGANWSGTDAQSWKKSPLLSPLVPNTNHECPSCKLSLFSCFLYFFLFYLPFSCFLSCCQNGWCKRKGLCHDNLNIIILNLEILSFFLDSHYQGRQMVELNWPILPGF